MRLDPRTPVVVGVGQVNQRVDRGEPPLEPVDLLAEALRRAEADSAGRGLLTAADSIRVVGIISWRYRDPGALVAERIGASPRHTCYTGNGGQWPQVLVDRAAVDIQAGRSDVVLVGGAEAWRTRMGRRADGERPAWTRQPEGVAPTEPVAESPPMSHPAETSRGVMLPVQVYPLFEQALRSAAGRPLGEHLALVSELWSRFSHVAADNPSAWIARSFTADEIRTPSAGNRMIGFPYTKRMNANNAVEQGAALILCSAERAEASGVPRDRWIFPHSGAEADDTASVSERGDLCSSPAIRAAGREALALADVGVDEVAHVDLYSCFPSAVEVAAAELGLSLDRPLTVTGGLSFAGGPWSNYVTHALATMTRVLREDAGSVGLCTANGGFLTRHAVGVYSTRPPPSGFRYSDCQDEADRAPHREIAEDHVGPAAVEAWTVMHDREGAPENGIATVLLDDGRRAWATSDDVHVLAAMLTEDLAGRPATISDGGRLRL